MNCVCHVSGGTSGFSAAAAAAAMVSSTYNNRSFISQAAHQVGEKNHFYSRKKSSKIMYQNFLFDCKKKCWGLSKFFRLWIQFFRPSLLQFQLLRQVEHLLNRWWPTTFYIHNTYVKYNHSLWLVKFAQEFKISFHFMLIWNINKDNQNFKLKVNHKEYLEMNYLFVIFHFMNQLKMNYFKIVFYFSF